MSTTVERPVRGRILSRAGRELRRAGRAVWWYTTNLMGDASYGTYSEHHRMAHPGTEPMSVREFWRRHYAEQDANPGSRCC